MLRRSRGIHMQLTSWWWWLVTCMLVAVVVVPTLLRPQDDLHWLFLAGCTYLAFLVVSNVIFARTGLVLEADRVIVHGRTRTYVLDRDDIERFGGRPADGGLWDWFVVPRGMWHPMASIHVFCKDGTTVVLRDILGDENACSRLAAVLNAWLQEPWDRGFLRRMEARAASGARGLRDGATPPERGLGTGRRGRPSKARLTRAERGGAIASGVGGLAGYVALGVAAAIASDPYDASFPPGRAGLVRRVGFVLVDPRADAELRVLGWVGALAAAAGFAFVLWCIVAVNRRRQADRAEAAARRADPSA
ncbi:hypothetical protein SAMN04489720_1912 [Agrococcus jejuensis]|uniref:Uncharacterized protein n=2 Tax=Agrococcus jejuensis TaxID=399736 RepID=A0A1G8E705_9MICO|nr:hypothetical protein SAMN04489720_1912 [Agrococcus jejuensis]